MEIFKLASQQQLRFQSKRGELSTEQLWGLSIDELDALVVSLDIELKQSDKKSFIRTKSSVKDKKAQLRFAVALEVLNTMQEEMQAATEAQEIREHNKKIIALIAEKKDESLKGKSIKQLEAMLK